MRRRIAGALVCLLTLGVARQAAAVDYGQLRTELVGERARWRARLGRDARGWTRLQQRLAGQADRVFAAWLGTRWGRGRPQTETPKRGKVNCGMFVARVLQHLGFRFDPWKLNRQAALDIIRTFVPRRAIRSFSAMPAERFVRGLRRMGPGLYLIGLDYHVGFLRVKDDGSVRHIHASYVTGDVADEPAGRAATIVFSRVRVVGKLLQPPMLRGWLRDRRFAVHGDR